MSEEIANELGFPEFYGAYRKKDGSIVDDHAWNYLPDGSILDATADQMEEGYDIRVVSPLEDDFERYLK